MVLLMCDYTIRDTCIQDVQNYCYWCVPSESCSVYDPCGMADITCTDYVTRFPITNAGCDWELAVSLLSLSLVVSIIFVGNVLYSRRTKTYAGITMITLVYLASLLLLILLNYYLASLVLMFLFYVPCGVYLLYLIIRKLNYLTGALYSMYLVHDRVIEEGHSLL